METEADRTHLGERLRAKGISPTGQRLAIAAALLPTHQHVTAEQLHDRLHHQGSRISKATVYNTLNLFVRKGLVREIVVDATRSYFDSNSSVHHHVYNVDTAELIDFPAQACASLVQPSLPEGTRLERIDVVVRVRNRD
jgi:Fur family iron response transcriptional regulator